MPIISVEILKTIDEREMQKATKEKQTKTERNKRNRSYSIFKQRELYESKHVVVECKCLKI